MEIIDALSKLGFTFWQVLVLGIILAFRLELKLLLSRILSITVGETVIVLSKETEVVKELESLSEEVDNAELNQIDIKKLIKRRINDKAIKAMLNIKRQTRFLWKKLRDNEYEKRLLSCDIKADTLTAITGDLDLLVAAKYFTYKTDYNYIDQSDNSEVLKLTISDMSNSFKSLIAKAAVYDD